MNGVQTIAIASGEGDQRLDRWFKRRFPDLPHTALQKLLRTGQVRVDGRRAKAGDRLEAGQQVRVPPLPQAGGDSAAPRPSKRSLSAADVALARSLVLHRDADVIVLNKPAGLAVQGGTGTTRHVDGLLDALADEGGERPRLVHRLDRDTSGVLVVARTAAAARFLTHAFRTRDVRKLYWAVTLGVPKPERGEIRGALIKAGGPGAERMVVDEDEGRPARTRYAVLERAGRRLALVALLPKTGRTHQLRAHLVHIGTPILGDGKYGGSSEVVADLGVAGRLHLHARAVRFPRPDGRGEITVAAPPPPHMSDTLAKLGFSTRHDDAALLDEDI